MPSRFALGLFVALLVELVFVLDLATGHEVSISIFYLIPIAIATWYGSRTAGLLLSVLCALGWLLGENLSGASVSNPIIPWWNMLVRLGFFVIVTQALATRRRIEAELVKARAEALAANEVKSGFLNRVSHELRTPLTAILGFADVLQKRSGAYLTPADQECLRRIRGNSQSLLRLVDGVLHIGRTEARVTPPVNEPVNVAALVAAVAADMRGPPLQPSVELRFEGGPGLQPVDTDPALLRQVVLNLVSNAVKFTEEGSICLRVLGGPDGRAQRIVVQDTGIGIAPEKIEAVFEPFEQADLSVHRRFGGAGLGLTIAKELCEAMGHTLVVDSKRGVGSTFTVILGTKTTDLSRDTGQFVQT